MKIHILFENEDWMPPLRKALASRSLEWVEHFTEDGAIDINNPPERGVWINRMSPSSHTRGHQGGVTYAKELLYLLERTGSRVINGTDAFALEVSKARQHAALEAFGIPTPRTIAVVGTRGIKEAARKMDLPFITKDNQGGKGLGVQLFRDIDAFDAYIDGDDFVPSPDGVTLLQQYIIPPEPFVTRVEIVDGEFMYAIRSSTEQGFELCPADACRVDEDFCPVGGTGLFTLRTEIDVNDPTVVQYLGFCKAHGLDVAGIEFVEDEEGNRYTYDINGTSNYNGDLEAENDLHGMQNIAALAERELIKLQAAS